MDDRYDQQDKAPPDGREPHGATGPIRSEGGRPARVGWARIRRGPAPDPGRAFDELAKDLARGLSRREALRRLAGGLGGALLASLGFGRLSLSPAAADPARDACLLGCDNTYNTCTLSCENQYQAQIGAAEATFRACKAHRPTSGPGVDACNHACEGPHSQATGAAEQTLSTCLTTCTSHRNTCEGGCPGGTGGSGGGQGNGAAGEGGSLGQYSTLADCQQHCNGCCQQSLIESSVFCYPGTDEQACGPHGGICEPCGFLVENKVCIDHMCCVPTDIAHTRCCAKQNICQSGLVGTCCETGCCDTLGLQGGGCIYNGAGNDQACGTMNQTCQDCTKLGPSFHCLNGQCCPACGSNRSTCCKTGCCNGNQCMPGTDDMHCGQSGGMCADCTKMGPSYHCVDGQCQASSCSCSGPNPGSQFTCCCCPGQTSGTWVNLSNGLQPNGVENGPGFCGSCSTTCASGATCGGGVCKCSGGAECHTTPPCDASFTAKYCDGSGACRG